MTVEEERTGIKHTIGLYPHLTRISHNRLAFTGASVTNLEPSFDTIEQELLPMIVSMIESLLPAVPGESCPEAPPGYADRLRILAEKSDVMARGVISAVLCIDSPRHHVARR